jgi:hypothetical protein
MDTNIYQVISLNHMEDIIAKTSDKIIVVLCTSRKFQYKKAKKNLYSDSRIAPDCLFVYIEYENFESGNKIPLESMPLFMFFYRGERLHLLNNSNETSIISHIAYLQKVIVAMEKEALENEEKELTEVKKAEIVEKKKLSNIEKVSDIINTDKVKPSISSVESSGSPYDEIKDKLVNTNGQMKELEQLERLIELKKLKALQDFDNKESKSESDDTDSS